MSIFEWNPAWETGNPLIDRQHIQLFQQLERLYIAVAEGKDVGETEKALMLLGEYVETHFRDEESLMWQSGYGDIVHHKEIHDDLRKQVNGLIAAFLNDLQPIPAAVMDFLVTWLKNHLAGEDQILAKHLRKCSK